MNTKVFLNNKLDLFTLRVLARFCHAFVTVGNHVTDFFVQKGIHSKSGITTIPNGVETDQPLNIDIPSLRKQFGFDADALIIGIVARLEWRKDHRTLIHAFSRVVRKVPKARLLVVGDGVLKDELEKLCRDLGIESAIHFAGARADVPAILQAIDIFTLSSLHEGLPIALLEAMAAGRAVVCTKVGEIPRVIIHERTGLLVPPGEIDSLAASLIHLAKNKEDRLRLGKNGREVIIDNYSMGYMIKEYEKIYQSMYKSKN